MACLVFFAFTTILGWDYYGERCLEYFPAAAKGGFDLSLALYFGSVFRPLYDSGGGLEYRGYFQRLDGLPELNRDRRLERRGV